MLHNVRAKRLRFLSHRVECVNQTHTYRMWDMTESCYEEVHSAQDKHGCLQRDMAVSMETVSNTPQVVTDSWSDDNHLHKITCSSAVIQLLQENASAGNHRQSETWRFLTSGGAVEHMSGSRFICDLCVYSLIWAMTSDDRTHSLRLCFQCQFYAKRT